MSHYFNMPVWMHSPLRANRRSFRLGRVLTKN
jgi:hypothetical protein